MIVIVHGAGAQPVELYATDSLGRPAVPSSATATIVDLAVPESDPGREILAPTPATIDAVSTTLTAAAGPREADARRLVVASVAGVVVGRRYAVQAAGAAEAFTLERVDGLELWAREELRARFEIGAAVVGLRVAVDFPAGAANDPAQLEREAAIFGVDWTLGGVEGPSHVRTMARIERRQAAPRASMADLLQLAPDLVVAYRQRSHLETHLAQADREITALLLWRGSIPEQEEHGEVGTLAVVYRALELAYVQLGTDDYADRIAWAQREAKRWTSKMLDGHRPRDAVETTRTTDRFSPRRRAALPKLIVGVGS